MKPVEKPFEDYRNAHHGKGESYHRSFTDNVYRSVMWEIEQRLLLDLLRAHFDRPGEVSMLDFACGSGRVLQLLENYVDVATGVDVTASMLEIADNTTRRSRLINCDITRSDTLDRDRFNLITAFRFFPNAEPSLRNEAMAKLATMLAPDGIMIFNNHIRAGSARHRARLARARRGRLKSKNDLHCMSDDEAAALVERHGLTILEERHAGILPILRDKKSIMPAVVMRSIEKVGSRMNALASLAANKLYVVGHERSAAA